MLPISEFLFRGLIGALLASFITAYILQLATKWQVNFKPRYSQAYKISLFSSIAILILSLVFGLVIGSAPTLVISIIGFVTVSFINGKFINHPENGAIGFVKGLAITVNQFIIGMAALGVFALLLKIFS